MPEPQRQPPLRRILHFENIFPGEPVFAECSACGKKFVEKPSPGEKTHELVLRLRAAFDAHDCHGQLAAS